MGIKTATTVDTSSAQHKELCEQRFFFFFLKSVTLYFTVSMLQCDYTFNDIIIGLGLYLG